MLLLPFVSEAAPLLTLLRRIRRRLRLWMAVEGAVVGAAARVIALAVVIAAAAVSALAVVSAAPHARGHVVAVARPLAVLAATVAIGALVRGARRIPLT